MTLTSVEDLERFRLEVRAFIGANHPGHKAHTGIRAPEDHLIPAMRAWQSALHQAGYLGIDWPEAFGGRADADPREQFIVAEEITRARTWEPPPGNSLAARALIDFGSAEQQSEFLPKIRSGEHVWCQLFSEPGAGSDLASMQTRARRDGDDWVVDGQKVWTTNGHYADMGYLLARTNPDVPKHQGITAFALDMRTAGIDIRPLREITGTTDFNEVFLENVRLPSSAVIGQVDDGWRVATNSLMHERAAVGGYGVELYRVIDDFARLAAERRPDDQGVRRELGRLAARVHVNDVMTQAMIERLIAGQETPVDAPSSKIFFSEINLDLIEAGMRLMGSDGALVEGDPDVVDEGWWQDAYLYARCYTIAGGANEVMLNVIAERGLGLPRERS